MQQTPRPQSMPSRMGGERGTGLRSGGGRGCVSLQGHGLAPHQASAGRHIEAGVYRPEHSRHPASGRAVFISPPRSHFSWNQASTRCRTNTEKPLRTKRDPSQLFASTRRTKPQQHGPTRLPVTQELAGLTPVGSVPCLLESACQLASGIYRGITLLILFFSRVLEPRLRQGFCRARIRPLRFRALETIPRKHLPTFALLPPAQLFARSVPPFPLFLAAG